MEAGRPGHRILIVGSSHFLANNSSHRNLYGRATFARMTRLCIAQDHETATLHSRGLDICRKLTVIMGLRYAKRVWRGPRLCKAMPGAQGGAGRGGLAMRLGRMHATAG